MTRDFSRDLTIMVAGSGNITMQALEESMGDWIFPDPDAEREVHVILPIFQEMGGAIRNLVKLGKEWQFKFTVVHPINAPMNKDISALPEDSFISVDYERDALEAGLSLLTAAHRGGNETAFIMAYNPESTYDQHNTNLSDLEIIGEAKNYQWLLTLNLCEALVDSFEGFKTTDEILKEERLQKEFEDKQREEAAKNPAPAKKATAPRKRAAKKVEKEEVKSLPVEPEKPLEEPSDPRNELSADVPIVIGTPDIQEDIREAHAQVEKRHMVAVSKDDLAELSQNIKELTGSFGKIMDTFTRILKDG